MGVEPLRKYLDIVSKCQDPPVCAQETTVIKEAAPMGFFQGLKTRALAPFSQTQQGRLDQGQRANEIYRVFKTYAGQTGINLPRTQTQQLIAFFKQHNLPVSKDNGLLQTPPNQTHDLTNSAVIGKIFSKVAQDSYMSTGQDVHLGQQYGLPPATPPATTPPPVPASGAVSPRQQVAQLITQTAANLKPNDIVALMRMLRALLARP